MATVNNYVWLFHLFQRNIASIPNETTKIVKMSNFQFLLDTNVKHAVYCWIPYNGVNTLTISKSLFLVRIVVVYEIEWFTMFNALEYNVE